MGGGCGPSGAPSSDADGSSDSGTSTSSDGSSTTGIAESTDDATAPGDTTASEPAFTCEHPDGHYECKTFDGWDSCNPGEHCVPEVIDGVFDPHRAHCLPDSEDPLPGGAECEVDPETCNDACDSFSFCHPQTADGLGNVCVSACSSSDNMGIDGNCAEDEQCVSREGTSLCWPLCDPLANDCPAGAPSCVQHGRHRMVCQPTGYGSGALGEACGGITSCQEGLACMEQELLGPGCGSGSCCTELCHVSDGAGACGTAGHECLPFHVPGTVPSELDDVGFCGLPSAHPCQTHPGSCPPPGIDDTYPWCSSTNEAACDRFRVHVNPFIDDCHSECICHDGCTDVGDCPIPATGTAVPMCMDVFGYTTCALSCAGGLTCPDGMTCSGVAYDEICHWNGPLAFEECVH